VSGFEDSPFEPEPGDDDIVPTRSRPVRAPRRPTPGPVRRRWAALITVVGIIVVVGVVSAVASTPSAPPAPGTADGVRIAPVGAFSSSAFCVAGVGTAATSTIYLTNSSSRAVTGTMTSTSVSTSGAPSVRTPIMVPARYTAAVDPATGLPAGSTASSFVFAGGGMVASQVVSGPSGWSTAPCASEVSPMWAFAGGSTSPGNTLLLDLFNPAASEAVVNISFLTGSGTVVPQPYQGLSIAPGQLVEENVGDYVQNAADIATLVTAESGAPVATELQQWSSASAVGLSLRLGAPSLSSTWRFAQSTAVTGTSGSTVSFHLANPSRVPVTATLEVGLSSGTVLPHKVVIAPQSIVAVTSGTTGLPQGAPFALTVTSTAPIVAGRSVLAASGATPPTWGSSSGTVTLANRWLVPAPGIPSVPGTSGASIDSVAVANPGPSVARVEITISGAHHPFAVFDVEPGRMTMLSDSRITGLPTLLVTSTQPVDVEEDSAPTGAPGVVSSTGFPFTGQT
jgi:hypothetical protein